MAGRIVRLVGVFRTVKVKAASTANVTISTLDAGQTLDGVTLAEGDRVLLKDQTTGSQNGVYVINADGNAATRAADWASGADVRGFAVKVTSGTANAGKRFAVYNEPAIVGTNDMGFIRYYREL